MGQGNFRLEKPLSGLDWSIHEAILYNKLRSDDDQSGLPAHLIVPQYQFITELASGALHHSHTKHAVFDVGDMTPRTQASNWLRLRILGESYVSFSVQ